MKTLLCLLMLLPAAGIAAPVSQGDRNRAMSELHATRKQFLDAIEGLSPAQWKFKPSADAWSVAEVAEHIAVSEDEIFGLITKKIVASPPDPAKRALVKGKDEQVLKEVPDRGTKAKAPEFLVPKGRWADAQALAAHFKESRDRTIEYVKTTKDELRDRFAPHPAMKDLDAYQWIMLMAAHTNRHVQQINEVKANPAFPKR
jgi:uncharacterized damage-inducible protein DinB